MDFNLVRLRLKQISQESGGLGPIHLLLIAALMAWVEYTLCIAYSNLRYALSIYAMLLLLLLTLHLSRADARFLWHQLPRASAKLFAEYSFFSLPLVLPALMSWQFWILPLHLLVCFALSKWKFYRRAKRWYFPWLSNILSAPKYLEWIAGIRGYWWVLLPIYLLSWIFCWLRAFPVFSLWIFTIFLINFYNEGEPLNVLRIQMVSARRLIRNKVTVAIRLLLILYAPQLIINAILHHDIWYFHLIFFILQLVALLFLIFSKYAIYEPNVKLKANGLLQGFALMGTLIPFIAPLPLILLFWYYPKAIRQLKKYKSTL